MPLSVREHIIEVAGALFYSRGIRAVGVDEIIRQADIAKATLYRHFRGKEEIVVACLEARRARLEARFLDGVYRHVLGPPERLGAAFDLLIGSLSAPDFRGCAFLMAVAEHGDSAAIRSAARGYKEFIRNQFFAIVRDHVHDPETLTEQLALLYEGAIATAVIRPDASPGDHAKRCALLLFSQYAATRPEGATVAPAEPNVAIATPVTGSRRSGRAR
ncbi:TetR/AcrR family transcriptional regulator [uncultured Alsobacter sp.]|uniref:TetR/AcrR family transcriptional regulator n=1 Tax=uncultured Alsobacter sp. TaxID=1748258 RepID=UPI0025FBD0B8|nr:TetR/AcrR family transcriptional regulator [uncultured Alsobacter sp.]